MGQFIDKTLETFERMAVAITELRQRVEALESVNADRSAQKTSKLRPLIKELPEVDRSHHVAIGARADSSRTGS